MGLWVPGGLSTSGGSSYTPCEWSTGTNEEIALALAAHYAGLIDIHDYWSVGDERTVTIKPVPGMRINVNSSGDYREFRPITSTDSTVTLILTNNGGKYLSDGTTECAFQVDMKEAFNFPNITPGSVWSGFMATYTTYAADSGVFKEIWTSFQNQSPSQSQTMPYVLNVIFIQAFPDLYNGAIFKKFINHNINEYYDTYEILSSRAETEITGASTRSQETIDEIQVDFYKTTSNRIKKNLSGTNVDYFLRSNNSNNDTYTRTAINTSGNSTNYYNSSYSTNNYWSVFGCI